MTEDADGWSAFVRCLWVDDLTAGGWVPMKGGILVSGYVIRSLDGVRQETVVRRLGPDGQWHDLPPPPQPPAPEPAHPRRRRRMIRH